MTHFSVLQGKPLTIDVTVMNASGMPAACAGTEPLATHVSLPEGKVLLLARTAWVAPRDGGLVIELTPDQAALLPPGRYYLSTRIWDRDGIIEVFAATLDVRERDWRGRTCRRVATQVLAGSAVLPGVSMIERRDAASSRSGLTCFRQARYLRNFPVKRSG